MVWGLAEDGEAKPGPISDCVPHCDRAGLGVDCNHIRLHFEHRFGLWQDGKWIDWTQLRAAGDSRVNSSWSTTPPGRDADIHRRHENGATQADIARLYELTQSTVSRILNGNHQRPLGRYGNGGVKGPSPAEVAAIEREVKQLREGTWQPHELGHTRPDLQFSTWPRRLDSDSGESRRVFPGSDAWKSNMHTCSE
jgi:hypothetical protein